MKLNSGGDVHAELISGGDETCINCGGDVHSLCGRGAYAEMNSGGDVHLLCRRSAFRVEETCVRRRTRRPEIRGVQFEQWRRRLQDRQWQQLRRLHRELPGSLTPSQNPEPPPHDPPARSSTAPCTRRTAQAPPPHEAPPLTLRPRMNPPSLTVGIMVKEWYCERLMPKSGQLPRGVEERGTARSIGTGERHSKEQSKERHSKERGTTRSIGTGEAQEGKAQQGAPWHATCTG